MDFLYGSELSDAIREVMSGENPRMAVAFLGRNLAKNLFVEGIPENLKVVCDIGMGGTNPNALSELGAPNCGRIRYLPSQEMHAKVYISDQGAVVGSANASKDGLVNDKRLEAGFLINRNSDAYDDAVSWFKGLYKGANPVDEAAIERALALFLSPPRDREAQDCEANNILNCLKYNPKLLGSVKFVIPAYDNDPAVKKEAEQEAQPELRRHNLVDPKQRDLFTDWSAECLTNWPKYFIEIFVKPNGVDVQKHKREFFHEGIVFSRKLKWETHWGDKFGEMERFSQTQANFKADLRALNIDREQSWGIYSAQEFADTFLAP